jgi:hypothetical protein
MKLKFSSVEKCNEETVLTKKTANLINADHEQKVIVK